MFTADEAMALFVGGEMVKLFDVHYIPGLHTAPLSDDHPDASVMLIPLRSALTSLAGRPVNIQASREFVMQFRGDTLGQPYLTLIGNTEGA